MMKMFGRRLVYFVIRISQTVFQPDRIQIWHPPPKKNRIKNYPDPSLRKKRIWIHQSEEDDTEPTLRKIVVRSILKKKESWSSRILQGSGVQLFGVSFKFVKNCPTATSTFSPLAAIYFPCFPQARLTHEF